LLNRAALAGRTVAQAVSAIHVDQIEFSQDAFSAEEATAEMEDGEEDITEKVLECELHVLRRICLQIPNAADPSS
jgi:hypothetical protein